MPLPAVQIPRARHLDVAVSEADVSEESVRDDDWPASDSSSEDANAARVDVSVARRPSSGPTVPSDADWREFRGRQRGKKALAALVASATALVVAGVAWSRVTSSKAPAAVMAAAAPERRVSDRAPEPPRAEPAPPRVTSETTAAPASAAATGASPENAATTALVTIKTIPASAVIFRARERLGSGGLEVRIERDVRQRFTAFHDGYVPSNFTLDGSRDSVTIRLKRVPKRDAPPPEKDVSPRDVSSVDSTAATVALPTATPGLAAGSPATAPTPTSVPTPEGAPAPPPDVSFHATPD
jgi:hypothetical protein